VKIDVPDLRRALETLRAHRELIQPAIEDGDLCDDSGEHGCVGETVAAVRAIVEDDWRPQDGRRRR
jgi:hypothetical protein